jgi:AmmeMemoRadiSam system protein A
VITVPDDLIPILGERNGTFVSIKKKGRLRGCIGTIKPIKKNLGEEIISNAISAATKDPRFEPVRRDELDKLEISVDVLTDPRPVEDAEELDPKRYGIIVSNGVRQGVLLPDIEVQTVARQVEICRDKAGIKPEEVVEIKKFEVERYR